MQVVILCACILESRKRKETREEETIPKRKAGICISQQGLHFLTQVRSTKTVNNCKPLESGLEHAVSFNNG